ncbi:MULTISPECIES: FeoA family protein [Fusobacterium]|uniref:FeoA family protein n=1 Tax=Fusobacterium TaxID=848 RepID=UPI00147719DB|nr:MULTISPECIES: FeoA family protein [Fusobacterium]NME35933.1 ferrous iron transport protein A [Fusobacterium sp. FSA-380-WT-3A]
MVIPLAFAEENKILKIIEITDKCKNKKALLEKGFCSGKEIILKNSSCGNFIVDINGCQYILGFSYAKNILVE